MISRFEMCKWYYGKLLANKEFSETEFETLRVVLNENIGADESKCLPIDAKLAVYCSRGSSFYIAQAMCNEVPPTIGCLLGMGSGQRKRPDHPASTPLSLPDT